MQTRDRVKGYRDEARNKPKEIGGQLAIAFCVVVRLVDWITDGLVAYIDLDDDDEEWRFTILTGILGITACSQAIIAAVRQAANEKEMHPGLAFVLGFVGLQPSAELYFTIDSGTKTDTLKILMNMATLTESIPACLLQSYTGYKYGWTGLMAASVAFNMLSTTLTLISAEKEMHREHNLGKLPLLSAYSIVLFCYRAIEVPARLLSVTLFAAEFGTAVLAILGLDLFVVWLIRSSTQKRRRNKAMRSREALSRSLSQLNRSVEDTRALGFLDEDEDPLDQMDGYEIAVHYFLWMIVFYEGIDPNPFLGLRLLEGAGMAALFTLFADFDEYQSGGLIMAAIFLFMFFPLSPLWQYYRSHAAFLHPTMSKPTAVQMQILDKIGRQDTSREEEDESESSSEEEPEPVRKARTKTPTPVDRFAMEESEADETEESDVVVEHVTVVREIPKPTKQMRTADTQYNWEEQFEDIATDATARRDPEVDEIVDGYPPVYENRKNAQACRQCSASDGTCTVM